MRHRLQAGALDEAGARGSLSERTRGVGRPQSGPDTRPEFAKAARSAARTTDEPVRLTYAHGSV